MWAANWSKVSSILLCYAMLYRYVEPSTYSQCNKLVENALHIQNIVRAARVTSTGTEAMCFGYHVSVEHDKKHPHFKLGGNRFMGAQDMAA